MSIDVMKQALEAFEWNYNTDLDNIPACEQWAKMLKTSIAALRAAIEQAQEPVAWVGPSWMKPDTRTWENEAFSPGPIDGWIPLYTTPRQWQGLTEEEINILWDDHVVPVFNKIVINPIEGFARAIEAKLKEKNS